MRLGCQVCHGDGAVPVPQPHSGTAVRAGGARLLPHQPGPLHLRGRGCPAAHGEGQSCPCWGHRRSRALGGTFAGSPSQTAPSGGSESERCMPTDAPFGVLAHLCPFPQGSVVQREPHAGHLASWTGSGFARMQEGGWVEFHVSDVPFSMEYDVIIRYEPQVSPTDRGVASPEEVTQGFWCSDFCLLFACSTRSPGKR